MRKSNTFPLHRSKSISVGPRNSQRTKFRSLRGQAAFDAKVSGSSSALVVTRSLKGQAAFEYMAMVGIAFFILAGLVAFSYTWTLASREGLYISTAESSVDSIVGSANLVYAQGYPAKTTILIQVPDNVDSILFQGSEVTFRVRTSGGLTDISGSAKANFVGSLPSTSGYYKVQVQALGDEVNVSQVQ